LHYYNVLPETSRLLSQWTLHLSSPTTPNSLAGLPERKEQSPHRNLQKIALPTQKTNVYKTPPTPKYYPPICPRS
jgi:hypothetical protein